jgi:hypothetical protein
MFDAIQTGGKKVEDSMIQDQGQRHGFRVGR